MNFFSNSRCNNGCNHQADSCNERKKEECCIPGPQGPAGGVLNFTDFYALMPPDNAATVNAILTVRNPAGNAAALGITPLAGGTRPVSAHLVIVQLQ